SETTAGSTNVEGIIGAIGRTYSDSPKTTAGSTNVEGIIGAILVKTE
ncbi:hypothetical protein A3Q56_00535, partial [Intoshia linei]